MISFCSSNVQKLVTAHFQLIFTIGPTPCHENATHSIDHPITEPVY